MFYILLLIKKIKLKVKNFRLNIMFEPFDVEDFDKDKEELKKLQNYINYSYYFILIMFIIILFFMFLIL